MDEKTDVLPSDQLPTSDTDTSAGIGTDADLLPAVSAGTDSVISTASTDTVISTDTLTDILTSTETVTVSDKISSSEASSTENLTNNAPTETLTSDTVSDTVTDAITPMDDLQSTEEISDNTKTCEDVITNKISSPDHQIKSSAGCELEEELKRLHEGDPVDQPEAESSLKEVPTDGNSEQEKNSTTELQKEKSPVGTVPCDEKAPEIELLDPVEMLTAADDASKDPVLIKNSQEDIKKIDVLVCGNCHEVFHFVEEFQTHKSGKCAGVSNILAVCEGETKQQVWGFTLWKNKQQKLGENIPSSWVIYQKWCKLPQIDKDAWISAGQRLQFCTQIGYAKIAENKPKPVAPHAKQQAELQVEKDPLALDGFESNKENSIMSNKAREIKQNSSEVTKKNIVKPVKLNSDVTILPSMKNGDSSNSNKAMRTVRSTEKREYVVERIVAKRFNPKRKSWEYQIKWENFPSEQNTWEPISNLNHCKQMVEEFEQQLKKLKAEKAKQQMSSASPKGRGKPIRMPQVSTPSSSFSGNSTPGRPQRTSKQKALNQVKAWCGNISDADEGGVKRTFEDDDSDDSFEKKMKYEEYSDDSDADVKPKVTQYKKIAPKPPTIQVIKNGVGKSTPLPQNVLIPDANGVVRINQKQLPSLSTGVYIMSKTAGIIKLDSTTSKVATSGGQTIVKVAPKIGQTQIKIVKKDGTTTTTKQIIQMSPNKPNQTTPPKMYKPVITKVKKPTEVVPPKATPTKIVVKAKEEPKKELPATTADDSDDGLEELPFPSEMPLPEPESPPSEFILDPFTGKIAGQEYPDPEPEPELENVKNENDDTSLENIVKLAAADITEDDLKSGSVDTPMDTEPIEAEQEDERPIIKTETITSVKSSVSSTPVKVTMTPTLVKSEPSILNRALNNSAILRKSLINAATQPKVQQRILNQSIGSRTHNVSSFIRTVPRGSNIVRTRPLAPRPKFNIAGHSVIRSQHESSPRNVYSKTPLSATRKIGNTTIRSAAAFTGHRQQSRIIQTSTNVHRVSTPLTRTQIPEKTVTPPKPKTVISMPSLIGDDEPSLSPPSSEPSKSPTLPVTTTTTPVVTPATTTETPAAETTSQPASDATIADISSFTLADNDNPIFITGDDGTVYQVAGQNEQGQTILLTQGSDGQQQCLLVTNEVAEAMETTTEEPQAEISMPEVATDVTEPLSVKTDDASDQVVAQVVRAEPPSPGGTHKVVVMLPDGNLMVTQVSPEEYASLELE